MVTKSGQLSPVVERASIIGNQDAVHCQWKCYESTSAPVDKIAVNPLARRLLGVGKSGARAPVVVRYVISCGDNEYEGRYCYRAQPHYAKGDQYHIH